MKKIIIWTLVLSMLLLSGCGTSDDDKDSKKLSVRCFGCEKKCDSDEINTDFGLCQDCMKETGAAYCTSCKAPSYTREMVEGLCKDCSASAATQTDTPVSTKCTYCGYSVPSAYTVGNTCIGCYSVRQGMCLKCLQYQRQTDGSHCVDCTNSWTNCAECGTVTVGSEMFRDICQQCYIRKTGVLLVCPICGVSSLPSLMKDGYCPQCWAMAEHDKTDEQKPVYRCSTCGKEFSAASDLYEGKCWSCYNSGKDLCIVCKKNPSQGYGPSGMECYDCYNPQDVMLGVFVAPYENVKIIIEKHDYVDYMLTYIDQNTEKVISRIPLSYYNSNTDLEKSLFFDLSEYSIYGPNAYVEIIMSAGARASFSYNSLINGMADTDGYYSPLDREI